MEIIALLTSAKELGIDIGHLGSLGFMYFMLRKDLMKVIDSQMKMIDSQIGKLIDAIKSLEATHNKRLFNLEDDMKDVQKKISAQVQSIKKS